MADQQDDQIMNRVRDGDLESFAELFDRHHQSLYRFFYHLSGSGALAEDLTQEVFFRMLKFRASFQPGAKFAPWMYQIARNAHVDHLRKRRHEAPLFSGDSEGAWEFPSHAPTAEMEMLKGHDLATLRRAMMQLSPERRELLVLSRWQNLRYQDIAQITGIEVGAVKARAFRAMKQLGEIFFQLQGRKAS